VHANSTARAYDPALTDLENGAEISGRNVLIKRPVMDRLRAVAFNQNFRSFHIGSFVRLSKGNQVALVAYHLLTIKVAISRGWGRMTPIL
jgi:hypothetical protein